MKKIIIIAGATGSGKTAIAINTAQRLNTEIISADSMQIFKRMNVGTAKVTDDETCGIKHYMIDIVEPNCEFSVAQYVEECEKIISDIASANKIPIICGGTGLYIDGLIYDFGFGIQKNEDLRKELSYEYDLDGGEKMYAQLMSIDPIDASKFHKNNKQRLIRAMEIYKLSGKVKTELGVTKTLKRNVELFVTDVEREILYDAINVRVDSMISNGLVDEVANLLNSGITFDMQSMQGIAYKEFKEYFNGTATLEQVTDKIKQNTRNYAKRQITWFKKYEFAKLLSPDIIAENIVKSIIE